MGSRRRIFDLPRTFWVFVWQMLQPNLSCRAAVRQVQAFCETDGLRIDESTSAYCQARSRLPLSCMEQALKESARAADSHSADGVPGWSRPVKVIDATSVHLSDTDANRSVYPYPAGQEPGCGFPTMEILALYSLNSGAILETVKGEWSRHDYPLFRDLWPLLQRDDVVVGDRAFCAYEAMAMLPLRGVDMVVRLHQARKFDRKTSHQIGPNQWLATWVRPPCQKSSSMTRQQWSELPLEITVRIVHIEVKVKGFRTKELLVATTLLDPVAYPVEHIAELYLRRWELEICFRDLKTTMGMEMLRCRTPEMVHKELLAYLIGHNFIRALIAQAAAKYQISRTRVSFKGTIDTACVFFRAIRAAPSGKKRRDLRNRLLETIVRDPLPIRPHRTEPRAVKKRPKNYQRLTKPRHSFQEIQHRSSYRRAKS